MTSSISSISKIEGISGVKSIDLNTVRKILRSDKITDAQKLDFMRTNKTHIQQMVETQLSSTDLKTIMGNRPLKKFRPLKNSFTKAGDKIILAKSLNIQTNEVDNYIKNFTLRLVSQKDITSIDKDDFEKLKTYVYRHGTKEQLVNFLDYELKDAKDILQILYKDLNYYTGGVADYFIRPIHRLDNQTMLRLYNVVDKNLQNCCNSGQISEAQNTQMAEWTLMKIYEIQNNNRFVNAVKIYKKLS